MNLISDQQRSCDYQLNLHKPFYPLFNGRLQMDFEYAHQMSTIEYSNKTLQQGKSIFLITNSKYHNYNKADTVFELQTIMIWIQFMLVELCDN